MISKRVLIIGGLVSAVALLGGCDSIDVGRIRIGRGSMQQGATQPGRATDVVLPDDIIESETFVANDITGTLTEAEKNGIIQMREEEKLARDVYTTLGAQWNAIIFSNIPKSEQTHTSAVKKLLDAYGIADPVIDDTVGIFTSPTMQQLYDSLVAQGSGSLLDALIVGATVEDLDIHDLQELLKTTTNQSIIMVYSNLMRGSRNHLRSFTRNIANHGGIYAPRYISQSDYDSIITSPQEMGSGRMGNGRGQENGEDDGQRGGMIREGVMR